MDSFQLKLKQAKKEKKKKEKLLKEQNKDLPEEPKVTVDQVNDVETLRKMLENCDSRGKRSRINRKIRKLTGQVIEKPNKKAYDRPLENGKQEPGQETTRPERPVDMNIGIEKQIAKEVKRNIKRKRQQKIKSEEEVDTLLKSFEERINKKLKKIEEAGEEVPQYHSEPSDDGFNDVEVDED